MAEVFVSYHEKSAGELAAQIAATLENAGISCWYAKRDMPLGGNFANEIPRQIDNCELFLLLLNDKACQSKHVANELTLAFGRFNKRNDIKILPLKIGVFQEPDWGRYFLALIQSTSFSAQPDTQELNQLAARIAQLLNREPPTKTPVNNTNAVTTEIPVDSANTVTTETPVDNANDVTTETPVDNANDVTTETPVDNANAVTTETPVDNADAAVMETPISKIPASLHVLDTLKDRVKSEKDSDSSKQKPSKKKKYANVRKTPWFRGAIAAALAIVILSGTVTYNTAFACAYVSMDVDESSVEFSINRMGRVIAVNAISADAQALAQSLESGVKNKTVDDAVSYTMDVFKDAGYLESANGAIIASVTSNTEKRSMELTQTVAQTVEGNKNDGVKLYLLEASNGDRSAALARKVSPGRYLIQSSGINTLRPRPDTDGSELEAPVKPAEPADNEETS